MRLRLEAMIESRAFGATCWAQPIGEGSMNLTTAISMIRRINEAQPSAQKIAAGRQFGASSGAALVSGFLSRPLAKEINFTVSIGISEVVLAGDEADAVLKRADQALYRAKQAGRDRCEVG